MSERGKWDGMLAIARFNWPFYAAAGVVLFISLAGIRLGGLFALAAGFGVLGSAYFLIGSLGVSHLVYDCSDLYGWKWLDRALGNIRMEKIAFCHSGFDEASGLLKQRFPQAEWSVLDHYDPEIMTEASIRRARKLFPPTEGTEAARFDRWPLADGSQDVVFGMLAIHELRSDAGRAAWFAEAKRCLAHDGKIILVEHVRDLANFVAFGPGFLHFHSVASWRKSWEAGGFRLDQSFRITPFVRVFVLKKS
jgi:SAM-dependent methyltransferase